MNGLTETIRLAREAYNAMDQLGNTKCHSLILMQRIKQPYKNK